MFYRWTWRLLVSSNRISNSTAQWTTFVFSSISPTIQRKWLCKRFHATTFWSLGFLALNVLLHLALPSPRPSFWHTNAKNTFLSFSRIWARMLKLFVRYQFFVIFIYAIHFLTGTFSRYPLPEKRSQDDVVSLVTCTLIWPLSMNVPVVSLDVAAPSLKFPF